MHDTDGMKQIYLKSTCRCLIYRRVNCWCLYKHNFESINKKKLLLTWLKQSQTGIMWEENSPLFIWFIVWQCMNYCTWTLSKQESIRSSHTNMLNVWNYFILFWISCWTPYNLIVEKKLSLFIDRKLSILIWMYI